MTTFIAVFIMCNIYTHAVVMWFIGSGSVTAACNWFLELYFKNNIYVHLVDSDCTNIEARSKYLVVCLWL